MFDELFRSRAVLNSHSCKGAWSICSIALIKVTVSLLSAS